jgi:hypothetical protein
LRHPLRASSGGPRSGPKNLARNGERVGSGGKILRAPSALLAHDIAGQAALSNFMMMHALPRIADMDRGSGFFAASLAAAMCRPAKMPGRASTRS